jgi:hypothetical protein
MNAVAPTRSTFVTVVAWIFLMLSGFGLLVTLLYSLGISAVQAWIIKRLVSAPIVAEFAASR